MNTRWLLPFPLSLSCALAGCGALSSRPGDDFNVTAARSEIELVQRVSPYALEFTVDGCDDFTADLSVPGAATQRLEPKPLGGGRWVAELAPDLLHPRDESCLYDTERPQVGGASLDVVCKLDGRSRRDNIQVTYATAWRATYRGRGPVDAVFGGTTPNRFYEVGSGWLDSVEASTRAVGPEVYAATSPSGAPLLAANGDAVHLAGGCPLNTCGIFWFVDQPDYKHGTMAGYLQSFRWSDSKAEFVRNVKVPDGAVDLVTDGSASLLVTETANATALLRIVDDAVTVTSLLEGETKPTKLATLDGERVVLTRVGDDRVRLRRADGSLVGEMPLPGRGPVTYLSLAPSGDAWVAFRNEEAWLSTLERGPAGVSASSVKLATELTELHDNTAEDSSFGVAWTTSGIVLRNKTGVEVFARSAPHARAWRATLATPSVRGAMGLGESVAVLTSTGLRIFDVTGALVGGADPMPAACRLDYYPRHAAVVAPETIALAGKTATYQFRANYPSTNSTR